MRAESHAARRLCAALRDSGAHRSGRCAQSSVDAPGQVEITLEHGDALEAMDQAVRYKRLVKGVAHKHGMQATFMAKPFDDLAGTGMHMHVSLADAEA